MGYCVDEMTTVIRDRLLENVQPHVNLVVTSQTRTATIDAVAMHLRYIADTFVEPQIRQALRREGGDLDSFHGNNPVLSCLRSTLSTAAGVLLTRLAVHGVSLLLGADDALLTMQLTANNHEQSCYDDLVLQALSGVRITGRDTSGVRITGRDTTDSMLMRFWQR